MTDIALDALTQAAISAGSDKYGGHLYTPIYDSLFASRRQAPLRLLEIGVGGYDSKHAGGLGLKMWSEYFPNAEIIGLDIHAKELDLPPRVKVFEGSQDDPNILGWLNTNFGPFDIIIDDGSHRVSHMLSSFNFLYPLLAANGFYCIEDTQTCFHRRMGGRPDGKGTPFEMAHRLALSMHRLEGYRSWRNTQALTDLANMTHSVSVFRNIIVFQRGANTYPSNMAMDFAHPQVQAVFDSITAEDARAPSAGSVLSRVDMLVWAKRGEEAAALATQAAEKYPTHLPMLQELRRMMAWANQRPTEDMLAELISRINKE